MTALQKELAELNDEFAAKKAQWDNEKKTVEKVQKLREELESLKRNCTCKAELRFRESSRTSVWQTPTVRG